MAEGKRYFWLKLYDDFFGSLRIKKLRKMAGGDTFVIIYLKMQLKAMKTDGVITFRGLEKDIVDELAIDLDEEPDNVRITVAYLLSCGLAESSDHLDLFLPYAVANTGSETASTQRWREWKARKENVGSVLDSNKTPTLPQQNANVDIEIEKEIEIDIEIDKSKKRFTPPTIDEVMEYCRERNNNVDAQRFVDYYTSNGWKVGKNPMKDWKAAVRTWERDSKPTSKMPPMPKVSGVDDLDRLERMLNK